METGTEEVAEPPVVGAERTTVPSINTAAVELSPHM